MPYEWLRKAEMCSLPYAEDAVAPFLYVFCVLRKMRLIKYMGLDDDHIFLDNPEELSQLCQEFFRNAENLKKSSVESEKADAQSWIKEISQGVYQTGLGYLKKDQDEKALCCFEIVENYIPEAVIWRAVAAVSQAAQSQKAPDNPIYSRNMQTLLHIAAHENEVSDQKGSHMAKVRERVIIDGETKWVTANSRQEAQLAVAQLLYDAGKLDEHKNAVKAKGLTLRQFVMDTYKPRFVDHLKPTTVATYEQYLFLNILPFLGDMPITAIRFDTIVDFRQWMATAARGGRKKNLNADSIRRVTGFLYRIFKIAEAMKVVDDNPVKQDLLPKIGEAASHHTALPPDDMDKIRRGIPFLKDELQRLYMALVVCTGMCPEEVRGLRWEHVHLHKRYCSMVRTVTYDKHKNIVVQDSGKTASSIRSIVLPEALVAILAKSARSTGYVVYGRTPEQPMSYSTQKRTFHQAIECLDFKGVCTSYDFRTTYATELCEAGLTSKQVADKMGHKDTRMVDRIYARTRHESVMVNAEVLDKLNESMIL